MCTSCAMASATAAHFARENRAPPDRLAVRVGLVPIFTPSAAACPGLQGSVELGASEATKGLAAIQARTLPRVTLKVTPNNQRSTWSCKSSL